MPWQLADLPFSRLLAHSPFRGSLLSFCPVSNRFHLPFTVLLVRCSSSDRSGAGFFGLCFELLVVIPTMPSIFFLVGGEPN